MNSKRTDIRYVEFSDVHFGHPDTPAYSIINNLDEMFDRYSSSSRFAELDAIFIAGDLFDAPLPLNSSVREPVIAWGTRLLSFCARHDIALVILEGTPSHDAKQSKLIADLAASYKDVYPNLDFTYVDELSIIWHAKLGRWLAMVPDCCRDTCLEAEEYLESEMLRLGIEKFDIAIMHGVFRYQLAYGDDKHKYREDWWLDRCNGYIHIGHHHTYTHYQRIIASGSLDRLRHGEPEPKGMIWVQEIGNERRFTFIENTGAKIYHTVEITDMSLERTLARLKREIEQHPTGSHIRIIAPREHPIHQGQRDLIRAYTWYVLKFEYEKQDDVKPLTLRSDVAMVAYTPVTLTPDNIVERMLAFVDETVSDMTPSDRTMLTEYLNDMV